MERLKCDKDHT